MSNTLLPIVLYGIPDRDCSASSSSGGSQGIESYYGPVDCIKRELDPDVRTVLVVEPDALGNVVINSANQKCQNAVQTYKEGIRYAIEKLNGTNVATYIDVGNSGWLGSSDQISSLTAIVKDIWGYQKSTSFRGLANNVLKYFRRLYQPFFIKLSIGALTWYDMQASKYPAPAVIAESVLMSAAT